MSELNVDFSLKLSLRLFAGGEKCFGPGLAQLLEGVDQGGSLRVAAAGMGMAYSKAWTTLGACEETLGFPLLTRGAGGSQLTQAGRQLLDGYRDMTASLEHQAQQLAQALNTAWAQEGDGQS